MRTPAHGTVSLLGLDVTYDATGFPTGYMSKSKTWCGHCAQWIETNGVLGPLRFMAQHRDGDCMKAPAAASAEFVPS